MRFLKCAVIILGILIIFSGNYGGMPIQAIPSAKGLKWKIENRVGEISFSVPERLELGYLPPKNSGPFQPHDQAIVTHRFEAGKVVVQLGITHGYDYNQFFRASCGNNSFESVLVSTENVTKPMYGVYQVRKFSGLWAFTLILRGKQNHYLFSVAWPRKYDEQDPDARFMSPEIAKRILFSLRSKSARTDAGE